MSVTQPDPEVKGNILVVDDDVEMCRMLEADLRQRGFGVVWHSSPEDALQALLGCDFDALLADLNLPRMDGLQLCKRSADLCPGLPVLVITAFGSLDTAIAAIRAGAYDFVTKPVDLDLLAIALERAVSHHRLQQTVKRLSEAVAQHQRYEDLIGECEVMHTLYDQMERLADTEMSVLIYGESGTGKELVARALHRKSRRKNGPFIGLNCAALPGTLLESELFGHKRGAFTDAKADRPGLILQAHQGTLLLDEIGDFPLELQPKLLRALESHHIRPIGSDQEQPFDVRILAATHCDLETAVEEGTFRKDLFYRLNVIQLEVPPLRDRGTDILLLAQHFLEQAASRSGKNVTGITPPAAAKLLEYAWPGNVRELRNAVEHALALTRHEQLLPEDLPKKIRTREIRSSLAENTPVAELRPLAEIERQYIQQVLKSVGGNRTQAARILGLNRKTLYYKLQENHS